MRCGCFLYGGALLFPVSAQHPEYRHRKLVKDVKGRNQKVLEIFIRHGAPAPIAYESKPHIFGLSTFSFQNRSTSRVRSLMDVPRSMITGLKAEDLTDYTIRRQSIDARKKQQVSYVYTLDVALKQETKAGKIKSRDKEGFHSGRIQFPGFHSSGSDLCMVKTFRSDDINPQGPDNICQRC